MEALSDPLEEFLKLSEEGAEGGLTSHGCLPASSPSFFSTGKFEVVAVAVVVVAAVAVVVAAAAVVVEAVVVASASGFWWERLWWYLRPTTLRNFLLQLCSGHSTRQGEGAVYEGASSDDSEYMLRVSERLEALRENS